MGIVNSAKIDELEMVIMCNLPQDGQRVDNPPPAEKLPEECTQCRAEGCCMRSCTVGAVPKAFLSGCGKRSHGEVPAVPYIRKNNGAGWFRNDDDPSCCQENDRCGGK